MAIWRMTRGWDRSLSKCSSQPASKSLASQMTARMKAFNDSQVLICPLYLYNCCIAMACLAIVTQRMLTTTPYI